VDSTWTLTSRLLQAQKVYQAHRSHAYQHAARVLKSHKIVTVSVVALNVFWLMPLAVLVAWGGVNGVLGLAMAYIPLILLCVKFKAGISEN
jgi:Fuc2NAc and GlcNAc transferase